MGHDSPEGIFLGQELLLDFATWLDLTSNADNTITVYQLSSKFQNTFWFFKTCWWLTGLSRLYDASQPPGRHTRYFKTMFKILVDRALMWHISFLFDEFRLTLDRFTCCAHVTIPVTLYMLRDLILTSYNINSLPVYCSTNKLLKTWLGKAKYFCIRYNSKTKQKPATKIQGRIFLLHWRPHAKIQALLRKFFFSPKSSLSMVLHSPLQLVLVLLLTGWQSGMYF